MTIEATGDAGLEVNVKTIMGVEVEDVIDGDGVIYVLPESVCKGLLVTYSGQHQRIVNSNAWVWSYLGVNRRDGKEHIELGITASDAEAWLRSINNRGWDHEMRLKRTEICDWVASLAVLSAPIKPNSKPGSPVVEPEVVEAHKPGPATAIPDERGLIVLNFEAQTVRTVMIDGAPYWVGKDVCDVLGYAEHHRAMTMHCKGRPFRTPLSTHGGTQQIRVISEPDLYRLIAGSKLPSAERFERWIFEEVLPSIRKTGGYQAPQTFEQRCLGVMQELKDKVDDQAKQLHASGQKIAELTTANGEQAEQIEVKDRAIGELAAANKVKTQQLDEARPSVAYCEEVANLDDSECLSDVAKAFGAAPQQFIDWCCNKANYLLFRRDRPDGKEAEIANLDTSKVRPFPYEDIKHKGWFVSRQVRILDRDKKAVKVVIQTRVTPLGMQELHRRWREYLRGIALEKAAE